MRRKVLLIEDEPSIRNILYVLLAALKCDGDVAYCGQQALAMIERESFDAVLLDLRDSEMPAGEVIEKINAIRPSLIGRVLCITSDIADPNTLDMIESRSGQLVSNGCLIQELCTSLKALFAQPQSQPAEKAAVAE